MMSAATLTLDWLKVSSEAAGRACWVRGALVRQSTNQSIKQLINQPIDRIKAVISNLCLTTPNGRVHVSSCDPLPVRRLL